MNVVIISGNLARDPEKSYTSSGLSVTRFTVAVNRLTKKEGAETADFIRVTAWDKQADLVERYLKKGSKVAVEGRIQTGSYDGKDGKKVYTTDVIANRVEFLDRKEDRVGDQPFGGQFQDRPSDKITAAPTTEPAFDESSLPGFSELEDEADDMPF